MKKQTKKSNKKTSEKPKSKSNKKKSKSEERREQEAELRKAAVKNQTKSKAQKQASTEEEQNNEVTQETENQTENNKTAPDQTEQPTSETIRPESSLEPQSRPPYNIETDLNQSQVQALRNRYSHLTKEHFEGGTAEEVLQRLAETTGTDINELRTMIKSWEG